MNETTMTEESMRPAMLGKSRTYNQNKGKGITLQYDALSVAQTSSMMPMLSTERINRKTKVLSYERTLGMCGSWQLSANSGMSIGKKAN